MPRCVLSVRPPRRAEPGAEGASGCRQKGSASSAALDVRRAFSRFRIFDLATALLCWKRHESLPVSMMWQWCVSRSRSAVVIFASPNTLAHSPKVTLVVIISKRPATPSPPGSPNSVFVSTPNDVDTNTLQFLLNSARVYACPAVGQ